MKLSKRGEYAIRAMIILGLAQRAETPLVRIAEITNIENIPTPFLEQIFMHLRSAGLVESRRGKHGGYTLAKPADMISLGDIIRQLDGPLAPLGCVSRTQYEPCTCPDEATCGLRAVMLDVRDAISHILDSTTLAQLVQDTAKRYKQHKRELPFSEKNKIPKIDPHTGLYEI